MRPPVTRSRKAARTPTRDCVLVGSGGESGAPGSTHHLCVAAGKAGATVLVRPEYVQSWRPGVVDRRERLLCRACLVCRASLAGRGMAVACATRQLMLAVPLRPETEPWVGLLAPDRAQRACGEGSRGDRSLRVDGQIDRDGGPGSA